MESKTTAGEPSDQKAGITMQAKHPGIKIAFFTGMAVCILAATFYQFMHSSRNMTQTGENYATVTADNFFTSYVLYPSAEEAIKEIPMTIKGEIIEVIKPFNREVVFSSDSAEQKIADKIGGSGRIVVQISGYRIRVLEKYKGNLATKDIVVSYNVDIFDQPLLLAVGDTMIWTLDAQPAYSREEFGTEQVYSFITPWLSAYYLTPNDRLIVSLNLRNLDERKAALFRRYFPFRYGNTFWRTYTFLQKIGKPPNCIKLWVSHYSAFFQNEKEYARKFLLTRF